MASKMKSAGQQLDLMRARKNSVLLVKHLLSAQALCLALVVNHSSQAAGIILASINA